MQKKTKDVISILWFAGNISWWIGSLALSLYYDVDVNPLFGNFGEIILNTTIFTIGLILIIMIKVDEDEEDIDYIEVDTDVKE